MTAQICTKKPIPIMIGNRAFVLASDPFILVSSQKQSRLEKQLYLNIKVQMASAG